jgi:hypothetical protein
MQNISRSLQGFYVLWAKGESRKLPSRRGDARGARASYGVRGTSELSESGIA